MSLISRFLGRDELPEPTPMRLEPLEAGCTPSRPKPAPAAEATPPACCDVFGRTGVMHSEPCEDVRTRARMAAPGTPMERFPYDAAPRPLITDETSPWAWLNKGGRRA